uniref:Predicted protein n=1 Tax=Hordeum vulgare subsp. vulgare TaxID=112509 RepID=F2E3Y3_HORVV|nr:predicted protein [Hordeum vulgare subsp. vulgare]
MSFVDDFKDYYAVLGIPPDSSAEEIRKAFKSKARDFHPDKHTENKEFYSAKFQEITEANNELIDEAKKQAYDSKYRAHAERKRKYAEENASFRAMRDALSKREKEHDDQRSQKKQKTMAEQKASETKATIRRLMTEGRLKSDASSTSGVPPPSPSAPVSTGTGAQNSADTAAQTVVVKWSKRNSAINEDALRTIFVMYGDIDAVVIKKNKAMISYHTPSSALLALNYNSQQSGPAESRLEVLPLVPDSVPSTVPSSVSEPLEDLINHEDYEAQTLARLLGKRPAPTPSSTHAPAPTPPPQPPAFPSHRTSSPVTASTTSPSRSSSNHRSSASPPPPPRVATTAMDTSASAPDTDTDTAAAHAEEAEVSVSAAVPDDSLPPSDSHHSLSNGHTAHTFHVAASTPATTESSIDALAEDEGDEAQTSFRRRNSMRKRKGKIRIAAMVPGMGAETDEVDVHQE